MNGWHNVTHEKPCPICGHDSWCSLSDDGKVCVCRRTPNNRPTKNGNGWIYRLGENVKIAIPKPPAVDVDGYFKKLEQGKSQVSICRSLTRRLTIPAILFEMMDVRWDRRAKAAAFPMRDAEGKVTGIRYRSVPEDPKAKAEKWSFKGGHDGLFYIPGQFTPDELYVCEGPTDMLATSAIGLINVVGRSSCNTGAALIRDLVLKLGTKHITVIADDDEPKLRPDGSTFTPGIDGARRLVSDVGLPYRIVFPPKGFKDMRAWYERGALTLEDFEPGVREV